MTIQSWSIKLGRWHWWKVNARSQASLLVCMRLFVCVCFYRKPPWRQRNGAQLKSVAQPCPIQLSSAWSFLNIHKETSVSTVSNAHHAVTSSKNTLFKCFSSVIQYTAGLNIIQVKPLIMPQQKTHHQGPKRLERRFRDNRGILLESWRMLLLCKLFCLNENTLK